MKKLVGLKTRSISRRVHHLLELCGGGMLTGLTRALLAGLTVYKYSYVDISHNARRIAIHRLRELIKEYPGQLKQEAIEGFMSLPQDVLKLGPSDFDNMPPVDLVMATPPCMPFSTARGKGCSSRMAQPFIACVNLIKDMYDKQKEQLIYVFENVPTTTRFTAIMEALGPPIKVEAVMLGSIAKRTAALWTN